MDGRKMNKRNQTDMYILYKDDPWGNKIPCMAVATEDVAMRLTNDPAGAITRVVEVPRNVQSLIKM